MISHKDQRPVTVDCPTPEQNKQHCGATSNRNYSSSNDITRISFTLPHKQKFRQTLSILPVDAHPSAGVLTDVYRNIYFKHRLASLITFYRVGNITLVRWKISQRMISVHVCNPKLAQTSNRRSYIGSGTTRSMHLYTIKCFCSKSIYVLKRLLMIVVTRMRNTVVIL